MKRKLIKKLEDEASKYVRKIGYCEMCGATRTLQMSHILPKGAYPSIRFHPLNVFCACYRCHIIIWHHNPKVAWEWALGYFSKERLEWIEQQKQKPGKVPDEETVLEWWKEAGWE